ncbi:hypothetical protein GCM10010425_49240 [Streptomyces spororaveus]|uniref:Uncharacterized protein n=2 Tax=Streptomyces spororaveus TaxID=284039 RepID=A0ABQ3T2B2_9ACTN|nr:hypothetical protein Sspor_00790 [Streptomyces spororaveus]
MAWRSPGMPWTTHEAGFSPPIDAAVAPRDSRKTSPQYAERYDLGGELLPGQLSRRSDDPFAGREAEIAAMAAKLKASGLERALSQLPPPPTMREVFEGLQVHQQDPSQRQSPRLR